MLIAMNGADPVPPSGRRPAVGWSAFVRTGLFGLLSLAFVVLATVAVVRGASWPVVGTDLAGAVVFALLARRVFPRRVPIEKE